MFIPKILLKFQTVWLWVLRRKKTALVILVILVVAGYFGYKKYFVAAAPVKYITAKVERQTLVSAVSGSGQVSATNQVDIKAKASGDLISLPIVAGQKVKTGQLLAQINAKEALKSVRDAQMNYDSAKLSLDKITQPTDALTILQAENSLAQAQQNLQQSQSDLVKAYDDGFNNTANAYLDLPGVITGLQKILFGTDFDSSMWNLDWYAYQATTLKPNDYSKIMSLRDSARYSYDVARKGYETSFDSYKNSSRLSDIAIIEKNISATYDTTKLIAEAVKNGKNFIDVVQDAMQQANTKYPIPTNLTTHQTSLDSYTSKTNSHLSSLLNIKQTIVNAQNTIESSKRTIAEKIANLDNLRSGADALDIKSQQISLQQRANSLQDAREKLADYSVRALFDGEIAKVGVKAKDEVSAGTVVATLITDQKTAVLSLNEVDVTKVKTGQRATITFDAIDDLTLTGVVSSVDAIGTVSQGVVSYNVQVVFDVQDERVKPGMSVSVNIILDTVPDVLAVASAAIKTDANGSYIEQLVNNVVTKKSVVIGKSNDTMTEIVSGLTEGEEIITQKITTGGATSSNSSKNTTGAGANQNPDMMRMLR